MGGRLPGRRSGARGAQNLTAAAAKPTRTVALDRGNVSGQAAAPDLPGQSPPHARLVQAWRARPECRIRLHFVPAYCPLLNPIERLWGLMHRHITQNKCYCTFKDFSTAMRPC
jgi:hypothetical protein